MNIKKNIAVTILTTSFLISGISNPIGYNVSAFMARDIEEAHGQIAQMLGDLGRRHAAFGALGALDAQQADAGGEHAAVHGVDALQLLRGDGGGVKGAG